MSYEFSLDELDSSLMKHGIDIVEEPCSVDERTEMKLPDQINRSNKHQLYMDTINRIRQNYMDTIDRIRQKDR